jgi:pimeloyl-ACP methyl ester carboxylesterase
MDLFGHFLHSGGAMSPLRARALLLVCSLTAAPTTALGAQRGSDAAAITDAGCGAETYVLLSGMVGGVAGFRRLEARLLEQGYRVVTIDAYRLSVDSADVTFAALARRVDAALAARGVTSARVVGHAHGAGVALRLAASNPQRVAALYFLDVGALPANRTKVFSASLRLLPVVARIPGGRAFLRSRFLHGLRENAGRHEWLDASTQDAYVRPVLDHIGRVAAMGLRLARAKEPDSLAALVSRVRVPLTVLLGDVPHPSGPDSAELAALAPLGPLLRVEHLPGVGHFPHEEAPAEVARHLLSPRGVTIARRPRGAQ